MPRVRTIDDVGAHIPGAKKNWLRDRMAIDDLLQLNDTQIVTTINKDLVWKKPDYAALVEAGMEPRAAALLKIVRDRISARPVPRTGISAVDNSKDYAEVLIHMRDELEQAKTYGEMKSVLSLLYRAYLDPATGSLNPSSRLGKKFTSIFARQSPFAIYFAEDLKTEKMAQANFHVAREDWQKGFKLKKGFWGNFIVSYPGVEKIDESFDSEQAAWDWIKEHSDRIRESAAKKDRKVTPRYRPRQDTLRREGRPDYREGRDVTADEFRTRFNFLGVQFGEWLPDKERQTVLNMGYDALMDLADIMDVEPEAISLGGSLSVAFGARGQGTAAAEYQPTFHIFNLTRLQGAGYVAHEWAHALSYWLAWGTTATVGQGLPAACGGDLKPGRDEIEATMAHRGEALAKACADLVESLEKRPLKAHEALAALDQQIAGLVNRGQALDRERAHFESREKLVGTDKKRAKELPSLLNGVAIQIMNKTAKREELAKLDQNAIVGTCKSEYLIRAEELDSKRSGDPYYTNREELMARSFETFVNDKLVENGGLSQYLVHSVTEADYDPEVYQGSPFIGGETRTYMNGVMQKFIDAARPVLALSENPAPKI